MKNRLKAVESGSGMDWATAEVCLSLAFLVWTVATCGMVLGTRVWVAYA